MAGRKAAAGAAVLPPHQCRQEPPQVAANAGIRPAATVEPGRPSRTRPSRPSRRCSETAPAPQRCRPHSHRLRRPKPTPVAAAALPGRRTSNLELKWRKPLSADYFKIILHHQSNESAATTTAPLQSAGLRGPRGLPEAGQTAPQPPHRHCHRTFGAKHQSALVAHLPTTHISGASGRPWPP